MIKRISVMAVAALVCVLTTENQSWGHGFGGLHGAVRVGGVRAVGVNRAVIGGYGNRGYGYGYGNGYGYRNNAGNDLNTLNAMRSLSQGAPKNPRNFGPALGLDALDKNDGKAPDSRAAALAAMNKSLQQNSLPSDAGLSAGTNKKK